MSFLFPLELRTIRIRCCQTFTFVLCVMGFTYCFVDYSNRQDLSLKRRISLYFLNHKYLRFDYLLDNFETKSRNSIRRLDNDDMDNDLYDDKYDNGNEVYTNETSLYEQYEAVAEEELTKIYESAPSEWTENEWFFLGALILFCVFTFACCCSNICSPKEVGLKKAQYNNIETRNEMEKNVPNDYHRFVDEADGTRQSSHGDVKGGVYDSDIETVTDSACCISDDFSVAEDDEKPKYQKTRKIASERLTRYKGILRNGNQLSCSNRHMVAPSSEESFDAEENIPRGRSVTSRQPKYEQPCIESDSESFEMAKIPIKSRVRSLPNKEKKHNRRTRRDSFSFRLADSKKKAHSFTSRQYLSGKSPTKNRSPMSDDGEKEGFGHKYDVYTLHDPEDQSSRLKKKHRFSDRRRSVKTDEELYC